MVIYFKWKKNSTFISQFLTLPCYIGHFYKHDTPPISSALHEKPGVGILIHVAEQLNSYVCNAGKFGVQHLVIFDRCLFMYCKIPDQLHYYCSFSYLLSTSLIFFMCVSFGHRIARLIYREGHCRLSGGRRTTTSTWQARLNSYFTDRCLCDFFSQGCLWMKHEDVFCNLKFLSYVELQVKNTCGVGDVEYIMCLLYESLNPPSVPWQNGNLSQMAIESLNPSGHWRRHIG